MQTSISARRNPIDGFRKYEAGLAPATASYWAATVWQGYPFMVMALLWAVATFGFIVVRCVFWVRGEGFAPSSFRKKADTWKKVLRVFFGILILQLLTVPVFCVSAFLARREGVEYLDQVKSYNPSLEKDVAETHRLAASLQPIILGSGLVSGHNISDAFQPLPPDLLNLAQALRDDLEGVENTISSSRTRTEAAYFVLNILSAVTAILTLMFVALACCGAMYGSRRLLNGSIFILPPSGVFVWVSAALFYVMLLNMTDNVPPCPRPFVAQYLELNSTQAYSNITLYANKRIRDHYSRPQLTNFSSPLLCELFAMEPSGQSSVVTCPYPSSDHVYTSATWEPNVKSMRCSSNDDAQCAAVGTPLTQNLYNTVVQLLDHLDTAEQLMKTSAAIVNCSSALESSQEVWKEHCSGALLRRCLMISWISSMVIGCCGIVAAPFLIIAHYMTSPLSLRTVDSVFNPGFVLPLKVTATGYSTQDYLPGAITQAFETRYKTTVDDRAFIWDTSKIDEYLTVSTVVNKPLCGENNTEAEFNHDSL